MKCGMLLDGARNSTIEAARLAMDSNMTGKKATAALAQELHLLTTGQPARAVAAEEAVAE